MQGLSLLSILQIGFLVQIGTTPLVIAKQTKIHEKIWSEMR